MKLLNVVICGVNNILTRSRVFLLPQLKLTCRAFVTASSRTVSVRRGGRSCGWNLQTGREEDAQNQNKIQNVKVLEEILKTQNRQMMKSARQQKAGQFNNTRTLRPVRRRKDIWAKLFLLFLKSLNKSPGNPQMKTSLKINIENLMSSCYYVQTLLISSPFYHQQSTYQSCLVKQ